MQELFHKDLKRNALLGLSKTITNENLRCITINIYRNHSIEPILSVISPFLAHCGLWADCNIGSYDDSLSFDNFSTADLELIFIDTERYKGESKVYILERMQYLRDKSNAPIVVLLLGLDSIESIKSNISNCFIFSLESLLSNLEFDNIFDLTKFEITATRLSNSACLALAQVLGLSIIPSLFLPHLKAIVLDLDNTLYSGVLGEDGIDNIILTPEHKALQTKILEYKKQGYLLALASKNEEIDVKNLFASRKDFVLQWSDFSCHKVNWNPKKDNLIEIAKRFNIGLDSLLFIDDNIAEIQNTAPLKIQSILATNPSEVLRILDIFPRLRKLKVNTEDFLRANDIEANIAREALKELSTQEYFSNLQIQLTFSIDESSHKERIAQLLNKTNQFIANYTRPSEAQVSKWLNQDEYCIITISMQDKLSDSGIIGIIIGEYKNAQCHIQDITISCRALGRKLETLMLHYAFSLIYEAFCKRFGKIEKHIVLHYQKGERNAPFLSTLQELSQDLQSNTALIPIIKPDTQGLHILVKGVMQ